MISYSARTALLNELRPQVSKGEHTQQVFRGCPAEGSDNHDSVGGSEPKAILLRATSALSRTLGILYSRRETFVSGNPFRTCVLLILAGWIVSSGCRSRMDATKPFIEFTRIPPAELTRSDKLDIIQGRVAGGHPGQQIILYARTGTWWIQPLFDQPFTKIQPDSTWINSTRLGSEYAALLVEPGYRPQATVYALPPVGGEVAAVATAEGATSGPTVSAPLHFSGYEWRVRNAPSSRGNIANLYDPSNAWTDETGALHLRVAKRSGQWTCAEVSLTRSLGYGTYSFVLRDTSHLEPAVVFDMFTWDYAGGDLNNREIDIEISRWGDPASKNAQCVVQPFYVPANVVRFNVPPGVLTHSFRWEPGELSCKTVRGSVTDSVSELVNEHVFRAGVPTPGAESVRIAIYVYGKTENPVQNDAEVVVERFEYLP